MQFTNKTPHGNLALKALYSIADQNNDGLLDENKIKSVLQSVGFIWLEYLQLKDMSTRTDPGRIDFNEFRDKAPQTLQLYLAQLTEKNGDEIGLLVQFSFKMMSMVDLSAHIQHCLCDFLFCSCKHI